MGLRRAGRAREGGGSGRRPGQCRAAFPYTMRTEINLKKSEPVFVQSSVGNRATPQPHISQRVTVPLVSAIPVMTSQCGRHYFSPGHSRLM